MQRPGIMLPGGAAVVHALQLPIHSVGTAAIMLTARQCRCCDPGSVPTLSHQVMCCPYQLTAKRCQAMPLLCPQQRANP